MSAKILTAFREKIDYWGSKLSVKITLKNLILNTKGVMTVPNL